MTLGFVTVMPPHEPASANNEAALASAHTPAGDPPPSLSAADRQVLAALERHAQVAAQPTSTAMPPTETSVPPTATQVPLTATPRPRATATLPAAAPPRPTVAAPPVVAEPTAPPPAPAAPTGLDTAPMDSYSQALFDATNKRRIDSGQQPLRANGYLVGIARIRSRDMADHNYFAHVSPITGDNAFTLMDKHGVPYGWAGENLAKNNYTVSECVHVADEALWNSPPHKENILNPNYTDMGIALVIDASGMKYFTIIFTGPA